MLALHPLCFSTKHRGLIKHDFFLINPCLLYRVTFLFFMCLEMVFSVRCSVTFSKIRVKLTELLLALSWRQRRHFLSSNPQEPALPTSSWTFKNYWEWPHKYDAIVTPVVRKCIITGKSVLILHRLFIYIFIAWNSVLDLVCVYILVEAVFP